MSVLMSSSRFRCESLSGRVAEWPSGQVGEQTVAKVKRYEDLVAWQKAMDLVEMVYALTAGFPSDEKYGLTSQMRRAAISIPSNIAEGWGRHTRRDLVRFLQIAHGSVFELQTQIRIAIRLDFLQPSSSALDLVAEVERILSGLIQSLPTER